MKKQSFIIFLLLIAISSYSQKFQNKIWNCKFGSSKEEAIKAIRLQGYNPEIKENIIIVYNIAYGGVNFDYARFSFYLNQFYQCEFRIESTNIKSLEYSYTDLKDRLEFKYGLKKEDNMKGTKIILYIDKMNSISLLFGEAGSSNGVKSFRINLIYCDEILNYKVINEI
ncbi:MAG: hypothetical protein ACYC25_12815 [Paludibacter sp.]